MQLPKRSNVFHLVLESTNRFFTQISAGCPLFDNNIKPCLLTVPLSLKKDLFPSCLRRGGEGTISSFEKLKDASYNKKYLMIKDIIVSRFK